jgi:hypothetical protein
MTTLANYLTTVRRLLHDAGANFWSDAELTDYINSARQRVVRDTGCNRILQSFTLPASAETITLASLPQGANTIDVVNINVLWSAVRKPLARLPWTKFNTYYRYYPTTIRVPDAFSVYGQTTVYFGPVPDIDYVLEVDTVVLPADLAPNVPDTIPAPFIDPIAYYAAHLAQYNQQAYDKAEIMKQEYAKQVMASLVASMTRSTTYPYQGL